MAYQSSPFLTHFDCFVFELKVWRGHLFFQRSLGLPGLFNSYKQTQHKQDYRDSWRHLLVKDSHSLYSPSPLRPWMQESGGGAERSKATHAKRTCPDQV